MKNCTIKDIKSRYIIDSRGNPTVEADVYLSNGIFGRAAVPSGASTGDKEALELRDKDVIWCGKGVNQAINNINDYIKPNLIGMDCSDIQLIDNGGWHFSFLKDPQSIKHKIMSYSHQEYNTDEFTNTDLIKEKISKGKDLFNRDIKYEKISINDNFPKYIINNKEKFKDWIL